MPVTHFDLGLRRPLAGGRAFGDVGPYEELKGRIRMPGFRPGKVPVALLRKQYGRSVMGEVLEQAVNQGSQKAIADHELRPALRPKIEVTSFDEGADLEFTMALEVLPEVPAVDLKKIYESLNSRLVLEKKDTEISALFAAVGAVLTVLAAGLSVLWFHRIL